MSCDVTNPQIQRPSTLHVWQKSEIEEAFEIDQYFHTQYRMPLPKIHFNKIGKRI